MGVSTALEISIASLSEGLYCAFSNRIIVSRRTPTCAANCSCVKPFNCLYFLTYIQSPAPLFLAFVKLIVMVVTVQQVFAKEYFQSYG